VTEIEAPTFENIFVGRFRPVDDVEGELLIALDLLIQVAPLLLPAVEEELVGIFLRVEDQHPLVDNLDDVPGKLNPEPLEQG
jgi:hypothetical protein